MKNNETDDALRAIVKSSLFVFIFLVFSKVITYFYRVIIARYFGPEIYGSLSLAVMISGFFVIFAVIGFDEGLLRYISFYRGKKDNKKISELFKFSRKTTFFLSLIFGTIMFLSSEFMAVNFFHDISLKVFFQIFSVAVPFAALSRIYLSTIRSFERIGWYSFLTNFLDGGSKLFFLLILIFLGTGVLSIHISYVLGAGILLLFSYLVFTYSIKFSFKSSSKKIGATKKDFFSYSWPLMFTYLIATLLSWIDTFAIGYFKSTYDVGIYNAAIPLAALVYFVPNLFMQLFAPLINKNYSLKKTNLIKDLSQQIGKWIFILNFPLVMIMLFFPGVIINFLFGAQYFPAATSLIFLTLGYLVYSQFTPSFHMLNMMKKSKLSLLNIIISLIINVILNIFLVPKYGINGAAFSTMISFIILALITGIEVYYFIKILPLRRKMFRIGIVGVISMLIILLIRNSIEVTLTSIVLLGSLFLLIYFALILLTKSLDKNDLMILRTFRRRLKSSVTS